MTPIYDALRAASHRSIPTHVTDAVPDPAPRSARAPAGPAGGADTERGRPERAGHVPGAGAQHDPDAAVEGRAAAVAARRTAGSPPRPAATAPHVRSGRTQIHVVNAIRSTTWISGAVRVRSRTTGSGRRSGPGPVAGRSGSTALLRRGCRGRTPVSGTSTPVSSSARPAAAARPGPVPNARRVDHRPPRPPPGWGTTPSLITERINDMRVIAAIRATVPDRSAAPGEVRFAQADEHVGHRPRRAGLPRRPPG